MQTNVWQQNEYFWGRTVELLGEQAEALFAAAGDTARGVTVNTRLLEAKTFMAAAPFGVAPGGFAAANFRLTEADTRPGLHPWHHAGLYYGQEPSASSAAAALDVQPGDRVLDMCAAPGGKSAQLAAALQGEGVLVSNEYDAARSRILLSNVERMGAPNVLVLNETADRVAAAFGGWFDKVLVDAPCSGEGMFRKEPQAVPQHSAALVAHCAALQRDILDAAAVCLAPGGVLVYSTCTFSPDEDEGQIGAFLARHPEFELLPTGLVGGCAGHESHCINGPVDVSRVRRIYPCHGGEGHFVAKLRKAGECLRRGAAVQGRDKAKPTTAAAAEFLRQYFPALADRSLLAVGESICLPPAEPLPDIGRLHVVRCGVLVGTMETGADRAGGSQARKGGRPAPGKGSKQARFAPAHHLLHAFGAQCINKEELTADDARTAAYLRGEEIAAATAADGWCAVLVDGHALGMGKVSGGRVKNHYPKGLRNLK